MRLPLTGHNFELSDAPGSDWAARLLGSLGAEINQFHYGARPEAESHKSWAASGAMFLTGAQNDAPRLCPVPLASCMQGALLALRQLVSVSLPADFDAATLLGERAALARFDRRGAISCGGSCRLLEAQDGWMAFNLARADDWELMPALFDGQPVTDWDSLAVAVKNITVSELTSLAGLFGLAFSPLQSPQQKREWFRVYAHGEGLVRTKAAPLVVDLSALWAGPLSSHLMLLAGARVIKVESTARPDGARNGCSDFFDLLNQGKSSVALDLTTTSGRSRLEKLLRQADIVIESSRPRALKQMGIDAEKILSETPGMTWISITGYGRDQDNEHRIAYGDDAGVAAGLSAQMMQHHNQVMFCADAIADPLTGMHVAVAAVAAWRSGGGYMLDIPLCSVIQHCMEAELKVVSLPVEKVGGDWQFEINGERVVVEPPSARKVSRRARPLGADTEAVLREYGI